MSDIKSVIALLCRHLHLSIDSSFKPEYFRLAKYNKDNDEVTRVLWETLHILSCHAVKDMQMDNNFDRYDDIYATKLYFAFMQYPTIEFYALASDDTTTNRELLLALGWLFAQKKVLNIVIRAKIATSILGHEYSSIEDLLPVKVENPRLPVVDSKSEMKRIVSWCGRINHNIKEIAELMNEKIKLTTKIHGASLMTSGLPHLSVCELALAKKSFGKSKPDYTKKDEESLKELQSLATMLDTHMQWTKKEHVFYDWMVTVIEENKKDEKNAIADKNICGELSNFLSLLRHVTKKKLHSIKTGEINPTEQTGIYDEPCISRFLCTQSGGTEVEAWSLKTAEQLKSIEVDVDVKMKELTAELRKMLKSIPNCIEI